MKGLAFLVVVLWVSQAPAQADRSVGVIRDTTGGVCSFVVVRSDGLSLTAEHCGGTGRFGRMGSAVATLNGESYSTKLLYLPKRNNHDEAVLFRLIGDGPFPYAPVALSPPVRGDTVWSIGYPHGKRSVVSGKVSSTGAGGFTTDATIVNSPIHPGHSGGPLFNQRGEVIGLASVSDFKSMSGWIGLSSLQTTMGHASPVRRKHRVRGTPELVVFTTPGCGPCEDFKSDAAEGYFPGWKITYVTFAGGRFDRPELWKEFKDSTGKTNGLSTPTFWIRGTGKVKMGYSAGRRGGLFQWLKGLFEMAVHAIAGTPQRTTPVPIPGSPELGSPEPQPYKREQSVPLKELRADIAEALRLGKDAKSRVEALKGGGLLISKARNGMALKSDVADLKSLLGKVKGDVGGFRDALKDPRALFGLLIGAVQLWRRRKDLGVTDG